MKSNKKQVGWMILGINKKELTLTSWIDDRSIYRIGFDTINWERNFRGFIENQAKILREIATQEKSKNEIHS